MFKIKSINDIEKIFPKTKEDLKNLINTSIANFICDINKIYKIKDNEINFENSLGVIDKILSGFQTLNSILIVICNAANYEILRDSAESQFEILEKNQQKLIDFNEKLYKKIIDNFSGKKLDNMQLKFFNNCIKIWRSNGLHLNKQTQKTLKSIDKKLELHYQNYQTNINNDEKSLKIKQKDLDGLSKEYINSLEIVDSGDYKIYPSSYILENCENENTRFQVWISLVEIGWPKNEKELNKIRKLRRLKANLLGYENYASYELSLIFENPNSIKKFIFKLIKKSDKKIKQEIVVLKKYLTQNKRLQKNDKINPWDLLFLKKKHEKEKIKIDDDSISSYFEFNMTLALLLKLFEKLFAIKLIIDDKRHNFWGANIIVIKVMQKRKLMGFIILDLFCRTHKINSFEEQPILYSTFDKYIFFPGLSVILGSLENTDNNHKKLLTLLEISSLMHEFGHALHTLLAPQKVNTLSGSQMEKDMIEMPAQFLELFLYDPVILKSISRHYITKQQIPIKLIKKIYKLHSLDISDKTLEQCYFALLSLELFESTKSNSEINKNLATTVRPYLRYSKFDKSYAGFDHLITYGTIYYSYLRSRIYALKLYKSCIKKVGNKKGLERFFNRYINEILKPGNFIDPKKLVNRFLSGF